MSIDLETNAVENFRAYLKIKTVPPNPDYEGAILWLRGQADSIGLEFHKIEFPKPALFAVWMTWKGSKPELPSLLLNSHIDVVAVDVTKWTRDPFAAEKDGNGNIYARGSQDMKSVGVQYLEAIRKLKIEGFVPERSVHVSFVPDEELGGTKGMKEFVKTPEFLSLNVGFALDEGITSPTESFVVSYGERAIWQLKFTARGNTGHALRFIEDTAAEKLQTVINSMLDLRRKEKERLESDPNLGLGDVTSVNMTIIEGGMQINVVPTALSVCFDMRVTSKWDSAETLKVLDSICAKAGPGVNYEWIFRSDHGFAQTSIVKNPWFDAFKATCDEMGLELDVQVFPGATDIRYLRDIGIPALGFSPINNTPVLLHDNDEFLHEQVFLKGIRIYEALIPSLSHVKYSSLLDCLHMDPNYLGLTVQNLMVLHESFRLLDVHNDERLNDCQVKIWLKHHTNLNKHKRNAIFELMDIYGSGFFDFENYYFFTCILLAVKDGMEKEFINRHARTLYNLFETRMRGKMTFEQFTMVGWLLGFEERAIDYFKREFDVGKYKRIYMEEFKFFAVICIEMEEILERIEKVRAYSEYRERLIWNLKKKLIGYVKYNKVPQPAVLMHTIRWTQKPYLKRGKGVRRLNIVLRIRKGIARHFLLQMSKSSHGSRFVNCFKVVRKRLLKFVRFVFLTETDRDKEMKRVKCRILSCRTRKNSTKHTWGEDPSMKRAEEKHEVMSQASGMPGWIEFLDEEENKRKRKKKTFLDEILEGEVNDEKEEKKRMKAREKELEEKKKAEKAAEKERNRLRKEAQEKKKIKKNKDGKKQKPKNVGRKVAQKDAKRKEVQKDPQRIEVQKDTNGKEERKNVKQKERKKSEMDKK